MSINVNNPRGGGGGGVSDHAALSNLDFPSAGHTGDLDLGLNKLSATTVTATTIYAGTLSASTVLATTTSATTVLATTLSGTTVIATTLSSTTSLAGTHSSTTVLATTLSGTTLYATTITATSFYATSSAIVPSGANPTVTVAGQVGVDVTTTTGSAFRFFSDAQYVLPAYQSKSFTILTPANADTYSVWRVPYNITLKNVNCMVKGGTSLTGALYEADANGASAITATVAAAIVAGNNTASTIAGGTIDAGDYILWITTATAGAVEDLAVVMDYTVDAG